MAEKKKAHIDDYPVTTVCPYCGGEVKLLGNDFIYGKTYGNGLCYACVSCRANVGVHTGSVIPLGRLANAKTVKLRRNCHAHLDPLWKEKTKFQKRRHAYAWLANLMGIPQRECHVAWLSDEELERAVILIKANR